MVKSRTNEIERRAADDGPVVSEGGRSPSTLSPGQVGIAQAAARPGPLAPGQRWSAARKREVVLRLLRGEAAELLSRELGLPIFKLEQWRRKADAALEGAPKAREDRAARPFGPQEVALMAETTSPTTGRRYGVAQVCRVWRMPRSSFYAAGEPETDVTPAVVSPARRGPKPAVSDDALLTANRGDLERSPWAGEGHRKVWARLRAIDGVRVSRKRVLRLMRDNALLSPHRVR